MSERGEAAATAVLREAAPEGYPGSWTPGVSNMTLCIAAGFAGGMVLAADTAGQFQVERGGFFVRAALPMCDQKKIWRVADRVVVAMAGDDAERLRLAIADSVGSFAAGASAREVADAMTERLKERYPGTPAFDSKPVWECLVCGPDRGGVQAYRLVSGMAFLPAPCGSYYGTIGSTRLANQILKPVFFAQPPVPREEAVSVVKWTMALSSIFYGHDDIGGDLEYCFITGEGVSDPARVNFDRLRVHARELLEGEVLPILRKRPWR